MPRDVNAYLSSQQTKSPPERAEEWAELEKLYNKKLWHQLTLKLLTFVKSDYLQEGTALVELHENFLADFENKINPLSLVEILKFVVKQITDYEKCVEFVTKSKEKVKGNEEAVVLCNIILGRLRLDHNDIDGVKKILEETEQMIESMDGISTVHGRYYQLSSDYHQIIGQHAHYYRDALRYLGCTELSEISLEEQKSRAFTLALAALLGEGVYNFGELLAHPILDSLKGTSRQWVVDLLFAFNSGSLAKYEELRPFWKEQADLAAQELALRQKISLLCLMEMTFRRPGNHRTLTFNEIATEARLPEHEEGTCWSGQQNSTGAWPKQNSCCGRQRLSTNVFPSSKYLSERSRRSPLSEIRQRYKLSAELYLDVKVELLVMKALSLELVRGSIDQVNKTVNMYWVQPRVLAKEQIANMKQRLDQWCRDVQSMEILLETKAHDILT